MPTHPVLTLLVAARTDYVATLLSSAVQEIVPLIAMLRHNADNTLRHSLQSVR